MVSTKNAEAWHREAAVGNAREKEDKACNQPHPPFLHPLITVEKIIAAVATKQPLKRKVRRSGTNFAIAML